MLVPGCAGETESSVTGTVLVDGELATSGTVTLHPIGGGSVSTGRIHEDGSFVIKTGQGDRSDPDRSTIAPGEYIVTVVVNAPPQPTDENLTGPPRPGGRLTAEMYADKRTSNLRYTIGPGSQVLSLALERATQDPPTETAGEQVDEAGPVELSSDHASSPPSESTVAPVKSEQDASEAPTEEEEQPND